MKVSLFAVKQRLFYTEQIINCDSSATALTSKLIEVMVSIYLKLRQA